MEINKFSRILWGIQLGFFLALAFCGPGMCGQEKSKKKVLFVNSYDIDNRWFQRIFQGAVEVLDLKIDENFHPDDAASPVQFMLHNMKTKKNRSEAYKKKAALEAKALIESWRPDVVICSDDNASKYLIVPYFREAQTPFVFCGVNWSAERYGFPCSNVTGMIEVLPIGEILNILSPLAKGRRFGYLGRDNFSGHKHMSYIREKFDVDLVARLISGMDEVEAAFQEIQQKADMVLFGDYPSLTGFNADRLFDILDRYTTIPTATFISRNELHQGFLVACAIIPEELGEWAATTALDILGGKSPADIPIVMNQKSAIRLNMKMAKRLGVKFPMELIQRARFVVEEDQ